jgi:hypothetical protein
MQAGAVRGIHGRFQQFATTTAGERGLSKFPSDLLTTYETKEVANGRNPFWITGSVTVNGTQYTNQQVLSVPAYGNGQPPDSAKYQPVNIGDDRYAQFFVQEYERGVLNPTNVANWWVGLDNSYFDRNNNYGMLINGNMVSLASNSTETWNAPFAQSDAAWINAAMGVFTRIQQLAPDMKLLVNEATISDPSKFNSLFATTSGVELEGVFQSEINSPTYEPLRDQIWNQMIVNRAIMAGSCPGGPSRGASCFTTGRATRRPFP